VFDLPQRALCHLSYTIAAGGAVAQPAEAETAETPATSLTALNNANMRGGPGTTFDRAGTIAGGEVVEADGQTQAADGFTWYRLTTAVWVRSDLVTAETGCSGLAVVMS
jgi:uncharacterized protein YraI